MRSANSVGSSGMRFLATSWPSLSMMATSWWGRHEARFRDCSRPVSSCRPPEPDVRVGPASGSPQAPSGSHRRQLATGQGEGIVEPLGRQRVTPSRLADRTRIVWQCRRVPALSGLLPPSPASPGSGCPQLHPAAASTRRRRSLTSIRLQTPRGAHGFRPSRCLRTVSRLIPSYRCCGCSRSYPSRMRSALLTRLDGLPSDELFAIPATRTASVYVESSSTREN
jgi:hypothetical protein